MSPAPLPCQGHPTCPEPSPRAVDPTAPEVVVGIAREVRGVDAAISECGYSGSCVWMEGPMRGPETGCASVQAALRCLWAPRRPFRSSSLTCGNDIVSHQSANLAGFRSLRDSVSTTPSSLKLQYVSFMRVGEIQR